MLPEFASESLEKKIASAIGLIREKKGAVVALSAGVDSSLVALLAHRALGDLAIAVTGVSESLAPGELEIAKETAKAVGIRHQVVETEELRDPNYYSNPSNRCYFCKQTLYGELQSIADRLGFESILDGTQMDDLSDDRPGLIAAKEAGVVSPLLLVSLSKAEVREAARQMGLSVWDKPAMPCLSSRIVHGEEITAGKLAIVGKAESYIKHLTGVRTLRVRSKDGEARIEVSPSERCAFFTELVFNAVDRELRQLGFSRVTLDLHGYSRTESSLVEGRLVLPMANVKN
jgi:pyridinium-3,5-biscarboxylic acid mononucleotide sulfurtransferase